MKQTREEKLQKMNQWRKDNPEINQASVRKWQKNNPEKVKAIGESFRKNNPEKIKSFYKKSYEKNKEKILSKIKERYNNYTPEQKQALLKRNRERLQEKRLIVLTHYGNGKAACVRCGYNIFDALDLDHINNDGSKDRPKNGASWMTLFGKIIKNNFPSEYQTLCRNCNWIKHIENTKK